MLPILGVVVVKRSLHLGAKENNLYLVAQVVKCSHSGEDQSMTKCLWKLLEFYRCPLEHVLHSFSFYFVFQVSRMVQVLYTGLIISSFHFSRRISLLEMTENSKQFHKLREIN